MSLLGATTLILPTSGNIAFSKISALSGITGIESFGSQPAPYKLSRLRGQDLDIPTGISSPIKFSQLKGAINYNYSYTLLRSGLGAGDSDTYPLYYYSGGSIQQNSYGVVNLSNISNLFTLKTKGSSTNPIDTFVRKDAKLICTLHGYLDVDVSLWMQINNQSYITKVATGTTIEFLDVTKINPGSTLLNDLITGIKQIAPVLVTTLQGDSLLDPFKNVVSTSTIDYTTAPSNILKALNKAALSNNELDPTVEYSIARQPAVTKYLGGLQDQLIFKIVKNTYSVSNTAPICYSLGKIHHGDRKQGWARNIFSVDLEKYPIKPDSIIKLFVGAGPGVDRQGHIWGSTTLRVDIINKPTANYTN